MHARLERVYAALQEKGYHPLNQIIGYILTEDPAYITNHNDARKIISRIDREILLRDIVKNILKMKNGGDNSWSVVLNLYIAWIEALEID